MDLRMQPLGSPTIRQAPAPAMPAPRSERDGGDRARPANEAAPMEPLVFEPYLRPMVWGGRSLGGRLGKALPAPGTFGESWEVSAHPHHVSRVLDGRAAGKTLDQLCREAPGDIYGPDAPADGRFPLLIKYLDVQDRLSIQVHPDDHLAPVLADETLGKTEAWVVIAAEPGARAYAGFREGVTSVEVERRIADGTLAEALHEFAPKPGDCLFLPAGTPHAAGGGLVLAEVQQTSDATFRLYDWDRIGPDGKRRDLHIAEALEATNWDAGPVHPVQPAPIPDEPEGERLVSCEQFIIDRFRPTRTLSVVPTGRMSLWMVLQGSAKLRGRAPGSPSRPLALGETVLVPASSPPQDILPGAAGATLLRITLPAREASATE